MTGIPGETRVRQMRMDDALWTDLGDAASAIGSDRSKVLHQLTEWFVRRPGVPLPERPISLDVARDALLAHATTDEGRQAIRVLVDQLAEG